MNDKTWWEINSNKIWRLFLLALLSVCGWVFLEVRNLPATTVCKEEFRDYKVKIEKQFNQITTEQNIKIKNIVVEQNTRLKDIDRKITEVNTFLRDYFSNH